MRAPRGRGVVTPDLAQQAGVLPNCQRQHDRKESGSKHVILATLKGKTCASQKKGGSQENTDIFTGSPTPGRGTCGISPVGAENSTVLFHSLIAGRVIPAWHQLTWPGRSLRSGANRWIAVETPDMNRDERPPPPR
jgi:hypothetical protein